jgi:multicomponent Na+:H+ antiporter subunit B
VIETLVDIILLAFLAITAIAINRIRNLFAVIMLFGIFSLLSAALFVILDAADVAFTEAAVGAGISTVLMLATLALTKDHEEKVPTHRPWLPLVVVFIPDFGDPQAPAQQHVAPRYISEGMKDTGVPNLVTAVLASYRGFDTLGEVTVIFTAGVGVLLLIGRGAGRRRDEDDS